MAKKTQDEAVSILKKIERDENGLIKGVNYIFNEDGTINWRKMVKAEYLVPNRMKTSETDISKLEDKDLLILLQGLKELAFLRGYDAVTYTLHPSFDYCAAVCKIVWRPNYETENRPIMFESIGDASERNTDNFARSFLAAIAENRAFVRCVRNFLKINITGQDEVNIESKTNNNAGTAVGSANPVDILQSIMDEKNISFDRIKVKLVKEEYPNAESFNQLSDVPGPKILELIERVKAFIPKS